MCDDSLSEGSWRVFKQFRIPRRSTLPSCKQITHLGIIRYQAPQYRSYQCVLLVCRSGESQHLIELFDGYNVLWTMVHVLRYRHYDSKVYRTHTSDLNRNFRRLQHPIRFSAI